MQVLSGIITFCILIIGVFGNIPIPGFQNRIKYLESGDFYLNQLYTLCHAGFL